MDGELSGGPAFPAADVDGFFEDGQRGMSLHQWYAGMALQGLIARPHSGPSLDVLPIGVPRSEQHYAAAALVFADAMVDAYARRAK